MVEDESEEYSVPGFMNTQSTSPSKFSRPIPKPEPSTKKLLKVRGLAFEDTGELLWNFLCKLRYSVLFLSQFPFMMDALKPSTTMTLRNLMESSTLSLSSSLPEKRSHQVPMQWSHMSLNILPIRSVSRMRKGSMYLGTRPVGNLRHSFSGLLLLEFLKKIFVAMLSNFYLCLFNQAVLLFSIFVSTTKKNFM